MRISKQRFIKLGVGFLILFVIYCVVFPAEKVQWTGFKKDTETSRSREITRNGKKITTVTKDVSGKTLWDWMSVLGVPLSLAILGFWLQQQQQRRIDEQAKLEREIAENNQKEEVLQAYFDRLSTLLVDKNLIAIATKLRKADEAKNEQEEAVAGDRETTLDDQKELLDAAVDVIRARTLSILRRLEKDGERKGSVIRFLIEAEVVSKLTLNLSDANLSGANLTGVNLSGANLSDANLSDANLTGANLTGANLFDADLRGAALFGANLRDANLLVANLGSADLSEANLSNVNLSGADLENINWDKDTRWDDAGDLETVVNMPEELKQQLELIKEGRK